MFKYYWTILDWITGDVFSSGKSFRNMADAKRSLKMHIKRRLITRDGDPKDFRFEVTKWNPITRCHEIVYAGYEIACADSEEEGISMRDKHREHVFRGLDVEGLDEEEEGRFAELVRRIRMGLASRNKD